MESQLTNLAGYKGYNTHTRTPGVGTSVALSIARCTIISTLPLNVHSVYAYLAHHTFDASNMRGGATIALNPEPSAVIIYNSNSGSIPCFNIFTAVRDSAACSDCTIYKWPAHRSLLVEYWMFDIKIHRSRQNSSKYHSRSSASALQRNAQRQPSAPQ